MNVFKSNAVIWWAAIFRRGRREVNVEEGREGRGGRRNVYVCCFDRRNLDRALNWMLFLDYDVFAWVLNFAHCTPPSVPATSRIPVSSVIWWVRHKTTCTTTSHHHCSGALLTTTVGFRCTTKETKETGVRVLSRVLDLCESAVAAEAAEQSGEKHIETELWSTIKNQQTWSKQWHR